MKILNLYAGIGGNRKLWGDEHEITAVENVPEIAEIYQDFFPKDKVIISDAHQYLLEHFQDYDFIWSSPPCPTHSRFNLIQVAQGMKPRYADMSLYQEIIFLKHWFNGKWCVENVISYYNPLIRPIESNNHYYWTNFLIPSQSNTTRFVRRGEEKKREERVGINVDKFNLNKKLKKTVLANCVEPEVGKQILDFAINPIQTQQVLI